LHDYDFTLDSYLSMMREAVPGYDNFEEATVAATGSDATAILELGTGTGETARAVLDKHPQAHLTTIDGSPRMVRLARENLPANRVHVVLGLLEDPLPSGPFDLVVSALAVHHLEGEGKADLYRRVAAVLAPAGRFVLADVVKPVNPSYVDPEMDHPSTLDENLAWLEAAGLFPEVTYTDRDLVVIDARTPSVSPSLSIAFRCWPPPVTSRHNGIQAR
jgi:tRNA (cmo5U34)-methyltransferase